MDNDSKINKIKGGLFETLCDCDLKFKTCGRGSESWPSPGRVLVGAGLVHLRTQTIFCTCVSFSFSYCAIINLLYIACKRAICSLDFWTRPVVNFI